MNPKPGSAQDCPQSAGIYLPIVDRNRCEGKNDCVTVCPFDVFEVRALSATDKSAMPFLSRLKAMVHGNRQAYAVRAEACEACGLCIAACPENAITLMRREAR